MDYHKRDFDLLKGDKFSRETKEILTALEEYLDKNAVEVSKSHTSWKVDPGELDQDDHHKESMVYHIPNTNTHIFLESHEVNSYMVSTYHEATLQVSSSEKSGLDGFVEKLSLIHI